MPKKSVLVVGATGNQGGSVARALSQRGHRVVALVRDLNSKKATSLEEAGVSLARGSFEDESSLDSAMRGLDVVFAVTTPYAGAESEVAQGRALVDAASRAKVPHFIYSSVSNANAATGIPHFDSKFEVEKYLAGTELNWTVTAPVFFTDNVIAPWNLGAIGEGLFRQALPADRKLQVVSVRDIGRFNAAVIEAGSKYHGARLNYAGDELSSSEMAKALSSATGRIVSFSEQPLAEVRTQSEDLALMFEWFDKKGYTADIPSLRSEFEDVQWQRFSEWAGDQDWNMLFAR